MELYLPEGNLTGPYFSSINATDISDKYYRVIDVIGYEQDMKGRYVRLNFANKSESILTPTIFMLDKNTGDSIYVEVYPHNHGINHFILVPYFEKLKQLYDNMQLISTDSEYPDEIDIVTNESVKVETNSKWLCNVLVAKIEQNSFYDLYFVLKNEKNQTIAFNCDNATIYKNNFFKLALSGSKYHSFLTEKKFAKRVVGEKIRYVKDAKAHEYHITQ